MAPEELAKSTLDKPIVVIGNEFVDEEKLENKTPGAVCPIDPPMTSSIF